MKKLLTTETMVESPLIILKIGDYTFGSYNSKGTLYNTAIGSRVTYPNFMQSIRARKVSGEFNTYTITMVYAIREGDDPNFGACVQHCFTDKNTHADLWRLCFPFLHLQGRRGSDYQYFLLSGFQRVKDFLYD